MKSSTRLSVVAITLVALSGCASNQSMDDQTQTKVEGAALGALVGAALGAAIGGDSQGAAIGAALGAGVGFVVGNEVAKRKARYASDEDFLNGEIQYVAEYNQTAQKYNRKLAAQIDTLEHQVAGLERDYQRGNASRSQLLAKRDKVRKQLAHSKQRLADLKKEYEVNVAILDEQKQKRSAQDSDVQNLQQEITQLKQNIEQLQASTNQLAQIDQRLSV